MGGKASGSHVGLGKGRIDYMAYMDALCNVAEFDGNYWVYEPWYNESGVDITEDVNEGVMWMTEWNLLYAVDEI